MYISDIHLSHFNSDFILQIFDEYYKAVADGLVTQCLGQFYPAAIVTNPISPATLSDAAAGKKDIVVIAAAAGAVGFLFLLALLYLIYRCCCKKKKDDDDDEKDKDDLVDMEEGYEKGTDRSESDEPLSHNGKGRGRGRSRAGMDDDEEEDEYLYDG